MNDAFFMTTCQSFTDLYSNIDSICHWERARRIIFKHGAQGTSLDIFDNQVVSSALFVCVEYLLYIGVADPIPNLCFAPIALKDGNITEKLRVGEFQNHFLLIGGIICQVDITHATMTQHTNNLVMIDSRT